MNEWKETLQNEEVETDTLTEEERRFVVDDDQKAEWCLRKIQEAKTDIQMWDAFYDAQFRKVKEACESRISFFEYLLRDYFRMVPKKETKTQQSYQLPSGKLVLKKQAPEYVRDDELIIAWLKANDEQRYVKVKESLDWAALKKTLTIVGGEQVAGESGEIIPGIIVESREDVFKVEVK